MENKQVYKANNHLVTNDIYMCACICMIVPILNLIFGWIGIKLKYHKECKGFKKQWKVCTAAFWVGICEIVIVAIAIVTLLVTGQFGVVFNNDVKLSLIINFTIFGVILIGSVVFLWKVKLVGRGYKLLFVLYTIFWMPLMLLRENTGTLQGAINVNYAWIALGAYGAIGVIIRPLADVMSWGTKSRKNFIYFSLAAQIATFIPAIIAPCTATIIIQSIAVGIGASAIGTYQLMFNEQYGKAKTFLTISILSIPPVLANFIASPLTNIFSTLALTGTTETGAAIYDMNVLKYMWVVGLALVIVALVLAFFLKEDSRNLFSDNKNKIEIKGSTLIWYFVLLLILGTLIGFIKFSSSGTSTVAHIELLEALADWETNAYIYKGYLSIAFSLAILVGNLLVGLVLVRYLNKLAIFAVGAGLWLIYAVASMFAINPYAYLAIHFLNGLAYGILYNLVLAFALGMCFRTKWVTPMGIYQAVLALGLMFGSSIGSWLRVAMDPHTTVEYQERVLFLINSIIASMIVLSFLIYAIMFILEKIYYKDHPEKEPKKSTYDVEFYKKGEHPKHIRA